MSTILNTNGTELRIPQLDSDDFVFYILTADWNSDITYALRNGAVETLRKAGVKKENIRTYSVPGTVELVNAAATVLHRYHPAGIIVIGCVIRGDTPHFDYVCMHTAQGVSALNSLGDTPVTFGVLTVDRIEQAQERAGGLLGNKGSEAACAAIDMANFRIISGGS